MSLRAAGLDSVLHFLGLLILATPVATGLLATPVAYNNKAILIILIFAGTTEVDVNVSRRTGIGALGSLQTRQMGRRGFALLDMRKNNVFGHLLLYVVFTIL
jgi:hypothetical protein